MSQEPSLFPALFHGQPDVVRNFLKAALHLRDLQQLYYQARQNVNPEKGLAQALMDALGIALHVAPADMLRIPTSGPVLVVANHPFGILDGMAMDQLLSVVRPDLKILTNSMLAGIEELRDRILPVDVFGEGRHNLKSLRRVLELLRAGHGAAFFPAGEVSHFQPRQRRIADGAWSTVAARCAIATQAPIVPMYFAGGNSWHFQVAGMIHPRLRTAQLASELLNKRGRTVEIRIGTPIGYAELSRFRSLEEATAYVRARTYCLAYRARQESKPNPLVMPSSRLGRMPKAIAPPLTFPVMEEMCKMTVAVETPEFLVGVAKASLIPNLMLEVGRLREETFRAVAEGSGRPRDLDRFDRTYTQLVLWDKRKNQVAGGYRMGWTAELTAEQGPKALYSSTLFRFSPEFFRRLGPAVELGRSFIALEYQKDYAPLLLLWQAIARTVADRPEAPVLFGPVSISAGYSQAARELIVRFVTERSFRGDLASLVEPRHPFRSRLTSSADLDVINSCLKDVESLDAPLIDVSGQNGVPVLLRQYLRLGGQVAGFNVDRKFANALDGLLIVDLRDTAPKLLGRYMGSARTAEFLRRVAPKPSITAA